MQLSSACDEQNSLLASVMFVMAGGTRYKAPSVSNLSILNLRDSLLAERATSENLPVVLAYFALILLSSLSVQRSR